MGRSLTLKWWQLGGVVLVSVVVGAAIGAAGGVEVDDPVASAGSSTTTTVTTAPTTTTLPPPPPTTTTTARPTTTAPRAPRQVAAFSGDTGKQTDTFSISSQAKKFVIAWRMTGRGNSITMMRPPKEYEDLVVNDVDPTTDQGTYFEPGTYYFEITTNAAYSITVTEHYV